MNTKGLFIVFAFALLAASTMPAFAQSDPISDNVVINEIDTNPPGDDSKTVSEWVELYNPTSSEMDIGGWEIASTTILKKTMTIPEGTTIKADQFKTFSYTKVWFPDVNEVVQLRDSDGMVIDQTPTLTDLNNDFTSWQRIYDGYDTDSSSDWKFVTSTAGSTNGKLAVQEESSSIVLTLATDKTEYLFGETATISGSVSEQVFIEKPTFAADTVKITISGPNYNDKITMYPDFFLKYKTTINLQKILGINEGIYDVDVEYGGIKQSTQFSVGNEIIPVVEKKDSEFFVSFDQDEYIPGQTAKISGKTTEVIPFTGLSFKVLNPDGKQIFDGTLYPNTAGEFSTEIFLTTVSPVYGEHQIIAEYGTKSAQSSFSLLEDFKEDKPVSLKTDKNVYGLGETVKITGRLNNLWIYSMDLEIKQVATKSLSTDGGNVLKEIGSVRLAGDSTFSHDFKIPNDKSRLGEFRVTVSKDVGTAEVFFKVVENPDEYVETASEPFTLSLDKSTYEKGASITISGKVSSQQISSSFYTSPVKITITGSDGTKITSNTFKPTGNKASSTLYSLTAVPDIAGNYKVTDKLHTSVFPEGDYIVKANYADGKLTATKTFSVVDSLNIEGKFELTLNKDVFGLNEKVILDGIVPGLSQGSGITITLIKPDGDIDEFGALANDSRFSWSWTTPIAEKSQTVFNERTSVLTNYGVYQIIISTDSGSTTEFFKVSPNPETDSLVLKPIEITTDRPIYNAGETLSVSGTATKREQGTEGLVVQDRAYITVETTSFPITKIYDAYVYLDNGGNFKSTFTLPVTLFKEGNYKVEALYQGKRANTIFTVDNDFLVTGEGKLAIIADTDKDEYSIGETVHLTGRPNKQVYLDKVDITVVDDSAEKITCGTFVCGLPGQTKTVIPSASGAFTFDYKIPDKTLAIGKYEIIVDAEFGKTSVLFNATAKPVVVETPEEKSITRTTEKFNRIADSLIPISVAPKAQDELQLSPRVITGSLFTPSRGDEAIVNIKITTSDGTCIVGPDAECMVSESTRIPGAIYKVVEIDGVNYNVRYSGPDVRLEKFTILPESSDATIPESTWNVEVLKDEQPSRFYYKVTYVVSE